MERDNLDSYLKRTTKAGPMTGIFWLPLPQELLGEAQEGHADCGPFYFAIDIDDKRLCVEFLLRSSANLHCTCIAYATPQQRQFVLDFIDTMLQEERIIA